MRLPEGRYPGGRLTADVRADRSRAALTREPRAPDETPLRAADEVGRDVIATLKRSGTRKGTAGALGRLVDSSGRRYHREQLLKTRNIPRPPAHRYLAAVINDLLSMLDVSFCAMRGFIANASHELRMPLTIITVGLT